MSADLRRRACQEERLLAAPAETSKVVIIAAMRKLLKPRGLGRGNSSENFRAPITCDLFATDSELALDGPHGI